MRYEIDQDTFAISIFEDGQDIPFQYQPHYPNGDSFDSFEEAESWAVAAVAAHSPEVNFYAPDGKNHEPKQKINYNARTQLMEKLGITEEEVKLLLLEQ
jgi:hypothetical protein